MEDILNDPGVNWGGFEILTCEQGVAVLDQRDNQTGKKKAGDALYTLAVHALAAELNFGAGAGQCEAAQDALVEARTWLCKHVFIGTGDYLTGKGKNGKSDDYKLVLELAATLDAYNNNELCNTNGARLADASVEDLENKLDETNQIQLLAYPNPFDQEATIEFSVPFDSQVSLDIYSLDGRHVTNLYRDDVYAHERYRTVFDATFLPSNVYIYKLNTDQGMKYGKLIPHNR